MHYRASKQASHVVVLQSDNQDRTMIVNSTLDEFERLATEKRTMWNKIETLQRVAKCVPYVGIVAGFVIALFGQYVGIGAGFVIALVGQYAKTQVEDRVKHLQKQVETQRQSELRSQLEASHNQLADLGGRILAATAVVDAVLDWDALGNSNDWKAELTGNVSYVAFAQESQALLVIRSQSIVGTSKVKGIVTFWATCDLNAPESQVNCNLQQLSNATYMQIGIPDLFPEGTPITGGTVQMTINGNKKRSFTLLPQKITDRKIIVTDIEALRDL